ncbi:MAG: glycosylase [Clostridiales bacterium]|jgi:maltose alpha-D-glucosyltransferase/alpha-amylase|nr:glycosylase [Clostridiales bacterium]
MSANGRKEWLKNTVFYEIYPTSFFDSDDDGVGDIRGIIQKLDYVKSLGCNGIWLNPIFLSEFRDGGYDVVDYYKVDPRFGDGADLERLFAEAHKRGIKILLDLVMGHTSDKCRWFTESSKSGRNEYSDYYIWSDSVWDNPEGCRMINGMSERDGNYMVNFFAMQPALNFGFVNPTVPWQKPYTDPFFEKMRGLVIDVIEFWLGKGADGFRVDMAGVMIKNDTTGEANARLWKQILDKVHARYPNAVFVSEWSRPETAVGKGGYDMDFLIHVHGEGYISLLRAEREVRPFGHDYYESYFRRGGGTPESFFKEFLTAHAGLNGKGFIAIPTGNHDLSRISVGRTDEEIITAFAFLFTLPSVPFVYYGDEIGMRFINGLNKDGGYNRTGSRTPMQWDGSANNGFSNAPADKLYLPTDVGSEYTVERQERGGSILNYTRELIALRKTEPALAADIPITLVGEYSDNPFVYTRSDGQTRITVAVNPKGGGVSAAADGGCEVLSALNASYEGGRIRFSGAGYIILRSRV